MPFVHGTSELSELKTKEREVRKSLSPKNCKPKKSHPLTTTLGDVSHFEYRMGVGTCRMEKILSIGFARRKDYLARVLKQWFI